jgi:hypothetical protein
MKFKAKKDVWWWRLIGRFIPEQMETMWTTIGETIYYPNYVDDPESKWFTNVIMHEQVHIDQYKKLSVPLFLFLYFLVPLPVGLAYFRWRFEREGYLVNIKQGLPISRVVDILWSSYGYPWPRKWMTSWFEKQMSGWHQLESK